MTSSLRNKNFKIDEFGDFSSDIEYRSKTDIFRDVISLIIKQCYPRRRREPPMDTKCPPATQRKQAKPLVIINIQRFKIITMLSSVVSLRKRISRCCERTHGND